MPGGTGPGRVRELQHALGRLVDGDDDVALLPYDPATGPAPPPFARPTGPGVVLATSGSTTGSGRFVDLPVSALVASARATHERLAGPGRWVACLPTHHIAGLQVLVRSHLAGTRPLVLDRTGGFDPAGLAAAVTSLGTSHPGYLSLVPTQLARVLDAGPEVVAPLRELAAILVGGAASGARLLDRARAARLPIVTTYGMTETGGGCVYDGRPLPGVGADIDATGRVWLTGPVLARGYLDDDAASAAGFVERDRRTWLRTNDHGRWRDGRLDVVGRLDDVIVTGGSNVTAGQVARVVAELGPAEVVVVGVPDEEWGQLVTVVAAGTLPSLAEVRDRVAQRLGAHHAPRALVRVDRVPQRGPGKPDRQAATGLAVAALRTGGTSPAHVLAVEKHG